MAAVTAKSNRGLALVVDDNKVNRLLLQTLLTNTGFEVIAACDGLDAIDQFKQHRPDIVFMDVMMPNMDGYEATTRIKALCGMDWVPVIFVTGLSESESLVKCVEAGGDDIVFKPLNVSVLEAKAVALERIRDLYRELSTLHDQRERDEILAEQVFNNAVLHDNLQLEHMYCWLKPASRFSGDVILTARRPDGDFNVLLGDFTGHGLAAAVGALPLSGIFRTMTMRGYSLDKIFADINRSLQKLLPTGIFLAACAATISPENKTVTVINAGMLPVYILDGSSGKIRRRIASQYPPLGIQSALTLQSVAYRFEEIDHLVMLSDGVLEAVDENGNAFGEDRLERSMLRGLGQDRPFTALQQALNKHCKNAEQLDDISLVVLEGNLHCATHNVNQPSPPSAQHHFNGNWQWQIALQGNMLRVIDPIPQLMRVLEEFGVPQLDIHNLFTIVTELYVNALDHGILHLDSSLKQQPNGFSQYFQLREQRLNQQLDGQISLQVQQLEQQNSRQIIINIIDSGEGFDPTRLAPIDVGALSGRGLPLVQGLVKQLEFNQKGNHATALYEY